MGYSKGGLRHIAAAEIRAEMARQRKTQAELASTLGRSQNYVSMLLRGDTDMSLEDLFTIAAWLGVPFHQLVPGAA